MRYAYFDPNTRKVLSWLDTVAYDINLPDNTNLLVEVTDKEWDEFSIRDDVWIDFSKKIVLSQPVFPFNKELEVSIKNFEITSKCEKAIVSGFHSNALGKSFLYPSKITDQQNLTSSVSASMITKDPEWITAFWCQDPDTEEWAYQIHTAEQIQTAGLDGFNAILYYRTYYARLSDKLMAATTKEEIDAIVWAPLTK